MCVCVCLCVCVCVWRIPGEEVVENKQNWLVRVTHGEVFWRAVVQNNIYASEKYYYPTVINPHVN